MDPESRKLYEILTGRSYATDHRMRDWLARSLAVEDASVEQQAPSFTPLVESFTSDEEDEFTVRVAVVVGGMRCPQCQTP